MTRINKTTDALLIAILIMLFALLNGLGCGDDDDDDDNDDDDTDNAGDDDDSSDDDDDDDDDDDNDDDDDSVCNETHSNWTVGLQMCTPDAEFGYTLYAPTQYTMTYLIDIFGRTVNSWESNHRPGVAAYLLENGDLLRATNTGQNPTFTGGGSGGGVERMDWDGNLTWEFDYNNADHLSHHDLEMLPSGNVLMIAWEYKSGTVAVAAGRNPASMFEGELWPDHIIEVEPIGNNSGTIVWEWHVWDHLIQDYDASKNNYGVVADHPELIDVNFYTQSAADWTHINAVDYNEEFDQIIVSSRSLSEAWVIDHSTTTAEAAGHTGGNSGKGGDILYRWGNPAGYDAGTAGDKVFYALHDAHWIPDGLPGAGNILVFNNGEFRNYSSADEFVPPVDEFGVYDLTAGQPYGPDGLTWTYVADVPSSLFSRSMSGVQRLENGNTLICSADQGTFTEVTANKEVVWEYINPVTQNGPVDQGDNIPTIGQGVANQAFRANRYSPDYPGLAGRDLTGGQYVEGN